MKKILLFFLLIIIIPWIVISVFFSLENSEFYFSKNHIINIFKKEFGVTPIKYINNLKLNRAKYLLEVTSDNLEEIAIKSGFNDYSHFYKLFQKETGISPSVWRNKKQTNPAQD